MIKAMRTLALDFLFKELGDKNNPPNDLEEWYQGLRSTHLERLSPFLVESAGDIEKVYILEEDADKDTLRLICEDMTEEKAKWLPFIKPTGGRSSQIWPIIKVSKDSPKPLTLKNTIDSWKNIAGSNAPWSSYFNEIVELLNRQQLRLLDSSVIDLKKDGYKNILAVAVDKIGERKGTVFLTVRTKDYKFPGRCPEYLNYLRSEKLAGSRYITNGAPAINNKTCPLCGASGVTVFPNALRGAGINLTNIDRAGAFPNIDTAQAWKRYALCVACADLLYIYKFYVLKKKVLTNGDRLQLILPAIVLS